MRARRIEVPFSYSRTIRWTPAVRSSRCARSSSRSKWRVWTGWATKGCRSPRPSASYENAAGGPQHKVVLTFDDGYSNLHQHAQPALARHGFSATVYLVTDHVGRRNDWGLAPRALGEQNILAWEQVNELSQSGWEIGAHTRSHPDLRVLPRPEVEREIVSSR